MGVINARAAARAQIGRGEILFSRERRESGEEGNRARRVSRIELITLEHGSTRETSRSRVFFWILGR